MRINRYKEALDAIKFYGKTENDVLYYGYVDGTDAINFDEFKMLYNNFDNYTCSDYLGLDFYTSIIFKDGTRLL